MEELKEIWINDFSERHIQEVCAKILEIVKTDKTLPILLYINSYGGIVDSLMMLLDLLKGITNPVFMVGMGKAMSCGSVLLISGRKGQRFMGPNSRLMIHSVSMGASGTVGEVRNSTQEGERLNQILMDIIIRNSRLTKKKLEKMIKDKGDVYLTAEQALGYGLIDQIGVPILVKEVEYRIEMVQNEK